MIALPQPRLPNPVPVMSGLSLHRIRSPLTRVGYGVPKSHAGLIVLQAGTARVAVAGDGGGSADQNGPRLIWFPPNTASEVRAVGGTRADLLLIRDTLLLGVLAAGPLGAQIHRALERPISLPLERADVYNQAIEGLSRERTDNPPGSDIAQELHLSLMLLHLWRELRVDLITHGRAPQGLAERFIALAHRHMREHWSVGRYAETMEVTRDRLGSAVQRATGMSPQAFLHQALLREARELLANTGMPVAQIAFRLGFSDAAYFSRFFSSKVGHSPQRFRHRARKSRVEGDVSYAAWP